MEALREDMYVGKGDKCVHKIGREAVIRVTEEPPGGMVCHCGGMLPSRRFNTDSSAYSHCEFKLDQVDADTCS